MNWKRTIPILTAGGILIAIVLGLADFQSLTAEAASSRAESRLESRFHGFGKDSGEYLAEALGISEEELLAAYQRANEAALDQAVEAGLITQAEAELMTARVAQMPFHGRFSPWLAENGIDFDALLAAELGISLEDLQEAQAEALELRLEAAVESGDMTEEEADLIRARQALMSNEDFQSSIRSAIEAAVEQAAEAGLITEVQASLILERLTEFDGSFGPGGFHGPGRFHGPGGIGDPEVPAIPETPSSTTPSTSF